MGWACLMMSRSVLASLLILVLSLLFAGCGDDVKRVHVYFDLEPIRSVYIDDVNITDAAVNKRILGLAGRELEYVRGPKTGEFVDNNIYNFLVQYKMILDEDIFLSLGQEHFFTEVYTCDNFDQRTIIGWVRSKEQIEGKYVVEGYSAANDLAQDNLLDDIKDLCTKLYQSEKMSDILGNLSGYENTSNEVRIPAQEVKDMLDGLGVPYDE